MFRFKLVIKTGGWQKPDPPYKNPPILAWLGFFRDIMGFNKKKIKKDDKITLYII